jgi:hypothetical protein
MTGETFEIHICPFCPDYNLEVPTGYPAGEVHEAMATHVTSCLARFGIGRYQISVDSPPNPENSPS